jgi:DNA-binding Lrp family transcriptional regulator
MLTLILKELRESGGAVSLNELSRRLGVERSALDGMLETLVRQGKLQEICAAGSSRGCHCSGCSCHCGENTGQVLGKSYELVTD